MGAASVTGDSYNLDTSVLDKITVFKSEDSNIILKKEISDSNVSEGIERAVENPVSALLSLHNQGRSLDIKSIISNMTLSGPMQKLADQAIANYERGNVGEAYDKLYDLFGGKMGFRNAADGSEDVAFYIQGTSIPVGDSPSIRLQEFSTKFTPFNKSNNKVGLMPRDYR